MTMATLQQLHALLPGSTLVGNGSVSIERVHSDTRSLRAGDLFVAIKGERFDGNSFLAQARATGAAAALCHAGSGLAATGMPGIEVGTDSKYALGWMAHAWRQRFELPLIAVTGSNGKTTVTQMVASILRAWKGEAALATQGNFNNDIGVPLTLLRLRQQHRVAVLELGMNHPGEIAQLAALAQPTVALVNNAQREHLEFMHSVEAVARENGSVVEALPANGTVIVPHADTYTPLWRELAQGRRVWTFAVRNGISAERPELSCDAPEWRDDAWDLHLHTPAGDVGARLRMVGPHNVANALAAAACAIAAGAPLSAVREGLESFEPVKGRSRVVPLKLGGRRLTLVDDSYNANPDSVQAALHTLASLPAPRLMVLGDMGEVGDEGEAFHTQAGALARTLGIDQLFTIGDLSRASSLAFGDATAIHFSDMQTLCTAVVDDLPHTASILVKGSRFMKMERVVETVQAACIPGAADCAAACKEGQCS